MMQRAQVELISQLRAIRARIVDEIGMVRVNRDALADGFEGPAARRVMGELQAVIVHLGQANQELAAVQSALSAAVIVERPQRPPGGKP